MLLPTEAAPMSVLPTGHEGPALHTLPWHLWPHALPTGMRWALGGPTCTSLRFQVPVGNWYDFFGETSIQALHSLFNLAICWSSGCFLVWDVLPLSRARSWYT